MFTICCLWHHAVCSAIKKLQIVDMIWYDLIYYMIYDTYEMICHMITICYDSTWNDVCYDVMNCYMLLRYVTVCDIYIYIYIYDIYMMMMICDMICLTPTRMQALRQQGLPNNNDELYSGLSWNLLLWVQGAAWLIRARKSSLRSARL